MNFLLLPITYCIIDLFSSMRCGDLELPLRVSAELRSFQIIFVGLNLAMREGFEGSNIGNGDTNPGSYVREITDVLTWLAPRRRPVSNVGS